MRLLHYINDGNSFLVGNAKFAFYNFFRIFPLRDLKRNLLEPEIS